MKTTVKRSLIVVGLSLLGLTTFAQDNATDANCKCSSVEGYRVVSDNCALTSAGFCGGWCEYKAIKTHQSFSTDWNCTKVVGADVIQKVSLYDHNNSLRVEVGTPVSLESEVDVALNLEGTNGTIMKYEVVNSLGETVKTELKFAAGSSVLKINTQGLAHGIYALKFEVNGEVINKNFVL